MNFGFWWQSGKTQNSRIILGFRGDRGKRHILDCLGIRGFLFRGNQEKHKILASPGNMDSRSNQENATLSGLPGRLVVAIGKNVKVLEFMWRSGKRTFVKTSRGSYFGLILWFHTRFRTIRRYKSEPTCVDKILACRFAHVHRMKRGPAA